MKRKTRTIRSIVLVAAGVATGLLMGAERPVRKEAVPVIPKTATIIPAPREMRVTGGEYWAKKPPKMEKVDGIPPEGYELSIRPDGMTIRYSDDAGAYYANMTLFHMGRGDAKAKCKVYPCLEIRDWPQFKWRGVMVDDSRHFMGKDTILRILQFDPLAGVEESARPHVVGGQCCNWTSHTLNRFDLEWKLWPRGFALAEVLWTYPDPAKRDFAEFSARAAEYRRRLIGAHVNCAPLK